MDATGTYENGHIAAETVRRMRRDWAVLEAPEAPPFPWLGLLITVIALAVATYWLWSIAPA